MNNSDDELYNAIFEEMDIMNEEEQSEFDALLTCYILLIKDQLDPSRKAVLDACGRWVQEIEEQMKVSSEFKVLIRDTEGPIEEIVVMMKERDFSLSILND